MIKLRSLLLPLVSGVLLGSGATWLIHSDAPANARTESATAPAAPVTVLIAPARLNDIDADTVIKDWLALPALSDETPAAEQSERRSELRALLARLPDDRFPVLLDALASRDVDAECDLRRLAFEVWTERNAPAAAQWAVRQTETHFVQRHLRSDTTLAVLVWARGDWDAAYAWSTGLTDAKLVDHLADELLAQLVAKDPQRAINLAQSRGKSFSKSAREKLFKAWAQKSPADAVRWFTPQMINNDHNRWTFVEAASRWIAANPTEAVDWLIKAKEDDSTNSRSLLETTLYQVTNLPGAAERLGNLLLARDDLTDQNKLLTSLLGYWQSNDASSALAWLDGIDNESLRGDLAYRVSRQWGSSNGATRLELTLRLPEGEQRSEAINSTLTSWAKTNSDEALAWLAKHPGPEYAPAINSIQGMLIGNLAASDPQGALARWEKLPDGKDKQAAMGPIAENWAKQDPAAAANWALAQRMTEERDPFNYDAPFLKVMQSWSTRDPEAALRWLEAYPEDQSRWRVVNAVSDVNNNEVDQPDPKARAQLLSTVKDKNLRTNLLQNHVFRWLRADYQAASAWLESSDAFSPEQVAQMLLNNDPYRN